MKKIIVAFLIGTMTVSVFAQPRVKDKTFLNNVIILNLGDYASQNLDKLDVWHYADLNINDITDKMYISSDMIILINLGN